MRIDAAQIGGDQRISHHVRGGRRYVAGFKQSLSEIGERLGSDCDEILRHERIH